VPRTPTAGGTAAAFSAFVLRVGDDACVADRGFDILTVLGCGERAAILDELLAGSTRIREAAEDAARRRLGSVDSRRVADEVLEAVVGLDQEELATHAGRTRHGYVELTEAAWMLLERAVEPWIEDIARRAALGLQDAELARVAPDW
jgi:hypothetical protein